MAKAKPTKSASYERVKQFNGQHYTGMEVGRTHHWHYDQGDWKERKITPDEWEFTYSVTKRRTGHAPEGSGVPIGTGYHWFLLGHQFVSKLNANDYSTQMVGLKLKLAHKRADKNNWNASANAQRKHLIVALKHIIAQLESDPEQLAVVPLDFSYRNKAYYGTAVPVLASCDDGACQRLDITLNGKHIGVVRQAEKGWKMSEIKQQGLVNTIGEQIAAWYEKESKMSAELFFNGWEPLLRILIVGTCSYALLILLLRASGKRSLSRLSAHDFIISMAIGSILAKILLSSDIVLAQSFTAMGVLVGLQYGMSWAEMRCPGIRRILCSKPTLLYHEGYYLNHAMKRERIAKADVEGAMHEKGVCHLEQIEAVILGSNGQLAVLLKQHKPNEYVACAIPNGG